MTKRTPRINGQRLSFRDTGTGGVYHHVYTIATVPPATAALGQAIYVSDGTANKRLVVSDGTNWRFPDGAVLS
jgi:hypothetical protein